MGDAAWVRDRTLAMTHFGSLRVVGWSSQLPGNETGIVAENGQTTE
jgi:hypothetical protein